MWDTSKLMTGGELDVVAGLAGDYNRDGAVNAADYTMWRKSTGAAARFAGGWQPGFARRSNGLQRIQVRFRNNIAGERCLGSGSSGTRHVWTRCMRDSHLAATNRAQSAGTARVLMLVRTTIPPLIQGARIVLTTSL